MRPITTLLPGLERRRAEERRADRDRAEAELGEAQRPEHAERAEEQRGEDDEPEPASIRRSRSAPKSAPGPWVSSGTPAGVAAAQATRPSEATPTGAERPRRCPRPRRCRRARARRARRRPRSRTPADQRSRASPGGDAATSHASAPVHENALASPWTKRAASSCHASLANPNSAVHARRSSCRRAPSASTPTRAATIPLGIAPEERAGRVRGREHAGAVLAEPELVRVVRQQRRQRREEERVDEDDRARQ